MKTIYVFALLLIAVFLTNCGISDPDKDIPTGYPTTYHKIGQTGNDSLMSLFVAVNGNDVCIEFDEFGRSIYPGCRDYVPLDIISDSSKIESIAKSFMIKNSLFTGITDTTDLEVFSKGIASKRYPIQRIWKVSVSDQLINGIKVLYSSVEVYINSEGVIGTGGTRHLNVMAPLIDNYSGSDAKKMIIGQTIPYRSSNGQTGFSTIRGKIQDEYEKYILPVYIGDELQLRVVYKLMVEDPLKWFVYFDSITGEIVHSFHLDSIE